MTETTTDFGETGKELGDCLLHADHHQMSGECWKAVIEFYTIHARRGWSREKIVNDYKLAYEDAVLSEFVRFHR